MRRLLKGKVLILGVVILGASLLAGVALAATQSGSGSSGAVAPQLASKNVEIVVETQTVLKGTPAITVLGAGWTPFATVLVKIKVGGTAPDIIVGSASTNKAGAFKLEVSALGKAIEEGVYTVIAEATTSADTAAAPLVVVAKK